MYEFGVDFIARCLAGEAINEAKKKQWKLVAGDHIILQDNPEDETTTISSVQIDVDDELSLVSENPVQNKVITDALQYKPDTIMNGGVKVANQKIMQLTKAQFDAIENKDPNTYYMVTDDADLTVRTAYVDVTEDAIVTVDGNTGSRYVSFEVPANFTMIEARINYEITWSCGAWNNTKSGLTSILTITPYNTAPPRDGRKIYMGVTEDKWIGEVPNQTHINEEKATLIGANYITYDNVTNRIRIEISKPIYNYVNIDEDDLDNTVLTINNFKVNEVGYIAYGSDNIRITEDSYTGGDGISVDENGVISIDAAYGASFELSIDPSTYVITAVLKDQDGTALSTQTIDLPLESLVVSGTYDSTTKTIILTLDNGDTITIPIGDLVSGLESVTNKVTSISDQSTDTQYPSAKCVYDAITAVPSVPAVTSSDNNKILTADYTGNTGSYAWEALPSPNYADATNKPSINSVTLSGNKTAADLGLVVPSDLNDYLTTASAANTYQTKAGMSSYLTTTAAAQDYLSKADAATTYQPAGTYLVPSDLTGYATETWVGQQGYLTSSDVATVATTGNYNDLTNKPTIPAAQVNADWNAVSGVAQILNKPSLAVVATSGSYNDLTNTPTIPAAQVNSDWNASSGVAQILNKPDLSVYLTSSDLNGYATETWVGQQGYLTSADEVPTVTSNDNGKVLTATYSGGTGVYSWQTPSGGGGTSDYTDLTNKPAIENHTLAAGNNTAASLGLATTSDISDMATQTWVGNQGYLTSADEVPTVTSGDDGKVLKATYSGGAGSYAWETAPSGLPASSSLDSGKVLTVDSSGNPIWLDVDVDEVPTVTSNDDGKVLTATYSGGVGSYAWASAGGGGGGLSVETDGTNYWITVNGIRLYFASSAPTGTIPDGSLGIGW